MRSEPFKTFLLGPYRSPTTGNPLTQAATRDAVSRCRRVERVMGVDLDIELPGGKGLDVLVRQVEDVVQQFGIRGNQENGIRSIVGGVRLYGAFRGWESRYGSG